jgi:hypothetical protein
MKVNAVVVAATWRILRADRDDDFRGAVATVPAEIPPNSKPMLSLTFALQADPDIRRSGHPWTTQRITTRLALATLYWCSQRFRAHNAKRRDGKTLLVAQ